MKDITNAKIVDITKNRQYEKYLYRCFAPMPFRKYRRRQEYLEKAVGSGFHMKALLLNHQAVGVIEYAPSKVSGYPITRQHYRHALHPGSEESTRTQFRKTTYQRHGQN